MEVLSGVPFHGTWKRYWRRKRYSRLDGPVNGRRNIKVVRIGGGSPRRAWKIRAAPKLRVLMRNIASSPLRLLRKLRDGYMNMMINLAGNVGSLNTNNVFGNKRIPKSRQVQTIKYSGIEVETRLVYEIYMALAATRELDPTLKED